MKELKALKEGIKLIASTVMYFVTQYEEGSEEYDLGMKLYPHLSAIANLLKQHEEDNIPE